MIRCPLHLSALALTVTVFVIASCSNSSSDAQPPGPPALGVAGVTPSPQATVAPTTGFAVRFAEPLETGVGGVLAGPLMTVSDGNGPILGTESYDAPTSTLVWNPTGAMPRGAGIEVRVHAGLAGTLGSVLQTDLVYPFRVASAPPTTPVELASSIPNDDLFVAMYSNGDAQIIAADQSWRFSVASTFVAPEPIPVGPASVITGLHLDAQTRASAVVVDTTLGGPTVGVSRRSGSGVWGPAEPVIAPAPGAITSAKLIGNSNGDLLVHATRTTGSIVQTIMRWSLRDTVNLWLDVPPPNSTPWAGLLAAMDDAGQVKTMHIARTSPNFLLVDEYALPSPAVNTRSLATGTFLSPAGFAMSSDGHMRVSWRDPLRGTLQRTSPPGGPFSPEVLVPSAPASASEWTVAPTGAVIARVARRLYRSEVGSAEWSKADLPQEPIALAMSPRGEMVAIYFELPNVWSLVRWRAGEPIDPPVQISDLPSMFNFARGAAVGVNGAGQVVAVLLPEVGGPVYAVRVD